MLYVSFYQGLQRRGSPTDFVKLAEKVAQRRTMFSQLDFSQTAPQYPDSMSISIPTDHEHWKLLALAARRGVALQAISFQEHASLGYIYTHLSLDTINEVVTMYM